MGVKGLQNQLKRGLKDVPTRQRKVGSKGNSNPKGIKISKHELNPNFRTLKTRLDGRDGARP